MQLDLFGNEIPKNNEPLQNVDITTTILYMSTEELKLFKKFAKESIKRLWGKEFDQKGNLTDLILFLLKKDNETT